MTNSIKSILSFVLCCLIIACSSPSEQDKEATSQVAKSKIINGNIQSIELGKDGYTADIKTKEEGVFVAVVSIVNLGGPDNYQQVNVGDKVTFEGIPNYDGDEPRLIVEKIINVSPTRTVLNISPVSFRGIKVGDLIADHAEYLQQKQLQTGEGEFMIYEIRDYNNNPAGYLMPDPNDEALVGDITVETQMAQTVKGIKVGDTFADLQKAIPTIKVHGSEIEGRTHAYANNLAYRLDASNFTYEIDIAKIPASTKIIQIIINRGPQAEVYLLNAQYSATQAEEYCWQTNKILNLYTKPTTNSLVQGKHFQGEVLSVLGTQIIDDRLWVNVTYRLQVKTGYEDQFADGQVHSSGVPTGWIGGGEIPKINCK